MFECPNCKSAVRPGRVYCSQSCAASFTQRGKASHNQKQRGVCPCGSEVSKAHGRYCSEACGLEATRQRRARMTAAWVAGSPCPIRDHKRIVIMLKDLRGDECERCGWCVVHPTTGKIPTQMEHKDGDSRNNLYENLVILCPNCHSLTPTFGSLNRGRGTRPKRKSFQEIERACEVCQTPFTAHRSLDKYCSRRCSNRAAYEKRRH